MSNVIFLGAPGAGKGTLAKEVIVKFALKHVSTGDLLREEKEKNTPLASMIKGYMDKGELVPDDVVIEVLKRAILRNKSKKGILFDGFPRTINQAKQLDKMLQKIDLRIGKVLFFDVSREVSVQRLSGRLVCAKCGMNFHATNIPPKKEGVCDYCSAKLFHRDDDNAEVVEKRWVAYNKHTQPLVDYYKESGLLVNLDADKDRKDVFEDISQIIRSLKNDDSYVEKRN